MNQDSVLFVEKALEPPFGLVWQRVSPQSDEPQSSLARSEGSETRSVQWSVEPKHGVLWGLLQRRFILPPFSFHLVLSVLSPGHQALTFAPARFSDQLPLASPELSPQIRLLNGLRACTALWLL